MIKSLTIFKSTKGFTRKLYHHNNKDVTFEFSPDINIITGRNGSGKSILLKIIKTHCCIDDSTYPTMVHPVNIRKGFFENDYYTILEYINKKLKNYKFPKSKLEWDGNIIHYLTPEYFSPSNMWDKLDSPYKFDNKELYGIGDVILNFIDNKSKGENVIQLLNKINNLNIQYNEPLKDVNDVWQKADNIFQNWLNSFSKEGKPTLLIDELDTNLDLDNQKYYWDYIQYLTKKWQVIVISHSIFAFKKENVNHIRLNEEYFNKIKKLKI